jgi:hypothetical protein
MKALQNIGFESIPKVSEGKSIKGELPNEYYF